MAPRICCSIALFLYCSIFWASPKARALPTPHNKEWTASQFAVNGSNIPDVDFDVGESFAGSLPVSDKANSSELFFWYFPQAGNTKTRDIVVWLNGGPGCSSLSGLLQENGPFTWKPGTFKPVENPWSWHHLADVAWIEQPAGTGFSRLNGMPPARNEAEVASRFLGFWKKFIETFELDGYHVYLTGESYAGY